MAYLYLNRGNSFQVDTLFDYKGKPQSVILELKMKQGLLGTEYLCGTAAFTVTGEMDWKQFVADSLFTVPQGVEGGTQDIRMRIYTPDGKEEFSAWLTDCIYIS